jgi:hypothetical protein
MMLRASLSLIADDNENHVCVPARIEDWSDLWTGQTVAARSVAGEHAVVFGTGPNLHRNSQIRRRGRPCR